MWRSREVQLLFWFQSHILLFAQNENKKAASHCFPRTFLIISNWMNDISYISHFLNNDNEQCFFSFVSCTNGMCIKLTLYILCKTKTANKNAAKLSNLPDQKNVMNGFASNVYSKLVNIIMSVGFNIATNSWKFNWYGILHYSPKLSVFIISAWFSSNTTL